MVQLKLRHDQEEVNQAKQRLEAEGRSLEAAIDFVIERALLLPHIQHPKPSLTTDSARAIADFIAFRDTTVGNKFAEVTDEDLELRKLEHMREKYGQGLNLPRY